MGSHARLKSQDATRHIPVIALTAHAMVSDRQKALAAGCDDDETKAVEFQRLLSKITSPSWSSGERLGRPHLASLLVVDDNEMNRDMLSRRLRTKRLCGDRRRETGKRGARGRRHAAGVPCPAGRRNAEDQPSSTSSKTLRERLLSRPSCRSSWSPPGSRARDVVEALGLGANDYVTKPINFAVAMARIEAQLSAEAGRSGSPGKRRAVCAGRSRGERRAVGLGPGEATISICRRDGNSWWATKTPKSPAIRTNGSVACTSTTRLVFRARNCGDPSRGSNALSSKPSIVSCTATGLTGGCSAGVFPFAIDPGKVYRMAGSQTDINQEQGVRRSDGPPEPAAVHRSSRSPFDRAHEAPQELSVRRSVHRSGIHSRS